KDPVHDNSNELAVIAKHHDRIFLQWIGTWFHPKHLSRKHKSYVLTMMEEMLPSLDGINFFGRRLGCAMDSCQREGIRLAGDFDNKCPQNRNRDRKNQLK